MRRLSMGDGKQLFATLEVELDAQSMHCQHV